AVMALPLGFALQAIGRWSARLRLPALGLIALLVGLNLFQTWQMDQGILHPSRMTKVYYWKVFGRTSTQPEDQQLLLIDRYFEGPERFTAEETHEAFVLQSLAPSEPFDRPDTTASGRLDGAQEFLEILSMPYDSITANYYAWIRTSAWVFPTGNTAENPTRLVVTFEHNGYPYKYRSLELTDLDLAPGQWHQVTLDYLTPEVRSGADRLKIYFWHRGQAPLFVDDVSVVAYEPEPK
ncbi:MAG: hypothetical protein AAGB22_02735, partial [Bacteroidota bacterium]